MLIDLLRSKVGALFYFCRRIYFYPFFKSSNIIIGRNLSVRGWKGKNQFGENLHIYDNVVFECHSNFAKIETGKNCIFSFGVIISCSTQIKIGNDVWVGEYSSIRDSTHQFSIFTSLSKTFDKTSPILIGNNVWIGKNSLILPGSIIGNNVVIAPGSVIKSECLSNSLYAGNPAVFIKQLNN